MKFLTLLAAAVLALGCKKSEPTTGANADQRVATEAKSAEPAACGGEGTGEACGGACGMAAAAPAEPMPPVPADATWTEVKVGGMKCGNCARGIERTMRAMPGVLAVSADFATGTVRFATAGAAQVPDVIAGMKANLKFEIVE